MARWSNAVGVGGVVGALAMLGGCGTELVNLDSGGLQAANGSNSYDAFISADGTAVGFTSNATNLVNGDTNGTNDVFVRDLAQGTTARVSVGSGGIQANGASAGRSVSADGTDVVFDSDADNLVASDTNASTDVFLHDRATGETTLVSVGVAGDPADGQSMKGAVSADGTLVAFQSIAADVVPGATTDHWQVYVRDLVRGTTIRVSTASDGTDGDDHSVNPTISADGRHVAFESTASNLVPGDTNGASDVFVKDVVTGEVERISVASGGVEAVGSSIRPSLSADGRAVAFGSAAANLVAGDTNGVGDSFVHDRLTGETTRVSIASTGDQADIEVVNPGISADGRFVTFPSRATTLVAGDTNNNGDVFVHDRATGRTERVSVTFTTAQAGGNSAATQRAISADGHRVVFSSIDNHLVADDQNTLLVLAADVFLRYR